MWLEENKQGGKKRIQAGSEAGEAVKSQRWLSLPVLIKNSGLHSEGEGKPLRG